MGFPRARKPSRCEQTPPVRGNPKCLGNFIALVRYTRKRRVLPGSQNHAEGAIDDDERDCHGGQSCPTSSHAAAPSPRERFSPLSELTQQSCAPLSATYPRASPYEGRPCANRGRWALRITALDEEKIRHPGGSRASLRPILWGIEEGLPPSLRREVLGRPPMRWNHQGANRHRDSAPVASPAQQTGGQGGCSEFQNFRGPRRGGASKLLPVVISREGW
jgi:hypothetical protein